MSISTIFINPEKHRLRSGWRLAIFFLLSPIVLQAIATFISKGSPSSAQSESSNFSVSLGMIVGYVVLVGWTILDSWFCLRKLDHLSFKALGYAFYSRWWRDLLLGTGLAVLMIGAVVVLQMIGGGTRLILNPLLWKSVETGRAVDVFGVGMVLGSIGYVLFFLVLAGAFEEILFRGYPFQTLLRDVSAVVPIILFAIFFGLMHWDNPNRTVFSTANTVLAGIWLAVAYLKTRALWFPTALHFMWNWTMGAFLGLPVSGFKFTPNSVFISSSEQPLWLTGGSYGPEGGFSATIVLIAAILIIWRARWLSVSPEMQRVLEPAPTAPDSEVRLGLQEIE